MDNTKKGLMTQFPCARGRAFVCKNIGDYIQAVASRQFVDPIDEYIEQEEADKYYPKDNKKIRLIMNGWFQWRAENWPPSDFIKPLLVSMHISPIKAKELLNPEGIDFLKKNGPVGCRDLYTKSLLDSVGVPAYYSACMTLTLGRKYFVPKSERKGVYIVDPYFEIPEIVQKIDGKKKVKFGKLFSSIFYFLRHFICIKKLAKNTFFTEYSPTGFLDRKRSRFRKYYKALLFYKAYSKKFDKELLLNAKYITHWIDVDMSGKVDNDDLLNIAESLVKKYASAKMVITSRIHAGLPSLGCDTPVVFIANEEVTSENGSFNTPGRLGGLLDFFRVLSLENSNFKTDDDVFKKIEKFDIDTKFDNKNDWRPYADRLSKQCEKFMSD